MGGALNNTSATPPNASTAKASARGSKYSPNNQAPAGTIRNGASDPISAALATLLCVAPAKNTARFNPKNTPGMNTWRTSRRVTRRPVIHSTTFQTTADRDHAPERDEHTGRFGALDERRAERERQNQSDDRQHPERPRAHRGGSRGLG